MYSDGAQMRPEKVSRVVYFDSNDEMVCESDVSQNNLTEGEDGYRGKNYTKVMLKATEQEKKRIREHINKQKKRNIQRFL